MKISILYFIIFFISCTTSPKIKYEGEINEEGKRHGQGTLTHPDGGKYVGEFKDDLRNGQGTLTWPDGTKYVGGFKDGKFNGQGILTLPDGGKFTGEFKDGKFNGQGILTLLDGGKFTGEFKDGFPLPIEGQRVNFIPYDEPPSPLSSIRPKYPVVAQEAGIVGTVVVKVFIDKYGKVTETIMLKSIPNSGLDEAAVKAIKSTKFKPAKQKGKPVGVWIRIPVNFSLK